MSSSEHAHNARESRGPALAPRGLRADPVCKCGDMNELSKGANAPLAASANTVAVSVTGTSRGSVDLMVLQLTGDRRVRDDDDFVFYNQPASPEGAVRVDGERITIDLVGVPAAIERLAVAVAMDDSTVGGLATQASLAVTVDAGDDSYSAHATGLTTERAAVLVEIYRHGGGWKVRNVSAGRDTGLAALVREHGVSVEGDAAPTASPSTPPPAPAPAPGPSPSAPSPSLAPVAPPQANAAPGTPVDLGKRTGAISLQKGQRVSIEKTPMITARIEWPAATDYDVFALVRYADGHDETVATFGTRKQKQATPVSSDGAVRHTGDVKRAKGARSSRGAAPMATETIEIRLNPSIVAVVPVVYSAMSNGTGSFRKYQVSMSIDNGSGDAVRVDAVNASDHRNVYTCVPGIVVNAPQGVVVESLELYSKPRSEKRPVLTEQLQVVMDAGDTNRFKW